VATGSDKSITYRVIVFNTNAMQEGREKPYQAKPAAASAGFPSRTLLTLFLFPSTVPERNNAGDRPHRAAEFDNADVDVAIHAADGYVLTEVIGNPEFFGRR
jgi:hypothetical protein